jgi:hypothetical protein
MVSRKTGEVFVVYPGDDIQGVVRFEGTWMLEQNSATK